MCILSNSSIASTLTLSSLHYVIVCGMLIVTVLDQELTTGLIHKAKPATIHGKTMLRIHFLPLLTIRFFNVKHIEVSTCD